MKHGELASKMEDNLKGVMIAMYNQAICQRQLQIRNNSNICSLDDAMILFQKSMKLSQSIKDSNHQILCLGQLALLKMVKTSEIYDLDEAREYLEQSLNLMKDEQGIGTPQKKTKIGAMMINIEG